MKIYVKSFFILGILFCLITTACNDELLVQPEQSLSPTAAFGNKLAATASLIGVYSNAQDLDAFGGNPQVIADFQADNVDFIGSFPTLQDIKTFIQLSDNTSIRQIWSDNYRVILAANAVIKFVPTVDDKSYTDVEKKQHIAEAKFMRALTYFNLVNLWGQPYTYQSGATPGVPITLDPDALDGKVVLPNRNTVAEVYAQIEKDLIEASPDLPASYSTPDQTRGRATKGAVAGLLSRLYLYKGDELKAIASADIVLGNTTLYNLAANYSFFDQNGVEDVFSIQMSATDNSRTGSGGWASFYQPAEKGARGDCPMAPALIAAFDTTNDKRYTAMRLLGANKRYYTTKFSDPVNNTDNSPIIRTTEILLNKAEALAKSSTTVSADAITLVNRLRTRAGLPALVASGFATPQALVDAILDERRKELCFEGHRRMDLLRNGKSLRTTGAGAGALSAPGAVRVVMPIPQREIDLGAALPQNAGYQ
jgi:starch-binding outer membrane protein, SusD/RagB family